MFNTETHRLKKDYVFRNPNVDHTVKFNYTVEPR